MAVSNGTAALHAAAYAIGIGSGTEVIVPPMTFAASANCVVFQGGMPAFADVEGAVSGQVKYGQLLAERELSKPVLFLFF